MRLYRFAIENSLYEVSGGDTIEHTSSNGRFLYYVDTKVSPVAGTQSDNAPVAFYLGYMNPEYKGSEWRYEDPSYIGRTLEVMRYERELWQTSTWKRVGSDLGWEIYQKPSRKQWVLMAMPTSRSVRELMVVPVESSIWKWWSRDRVIADMRNQTAVEDLIRGSGIEGSLGKSRAESSGGAVEVVVEPVYATIKHRMRSHRVKLGFDYPFNPDHYNPYGSDKGWPLYSVDGKQWKVSYDIGDPEKTAVFTPFRMEEDGGNSSPVIDINIVDMPLRFTNIVANGEITRVVLRDGSPFDPNNYQIYDIDPEGWPIFLVDRVEWVVKKAYDDTSSLPFAKFERRIIEQSVNVPVDTIYRQGVPMVVELPFDAPFIPSEQTVHGRTHDGWNEYVIGGRLWKVSAVDGVAVFTEMTWPVIEVITEVEKEKEKEEVKEEGVVPVVVVKDDEKKEDPVIIELGGGEKEKEDDMTDPKLEVSYVPFVALVGLLGLFSIMAQRK